MRQKAAVGTICCAALFWLASVAMAKPPIPTTISRDAAMVVGTDLFSTGRVSSHNPKCVARRTVRLVYFYPEGKRLVDTDLTSAHGVWGGVGSANGLTGLRFTVTRKKVGPRRHRRTCAAASGQITD